MLARSFLSADALGLAEVERDALITVLGMMERGDIDDEHFSMATYFRDRSCGTPSCICGWAHSVSGGAAFPEISQIGVGYLMSMRLPLQAQLLFDMFDTGGRPGVRDCNSVDRARVALASYLTTGEADWR